MKKYILSFLILACLAVVLVISLPKENKIKEYNTEEIELAIYINDEETNKIPGKDSGYYYDREKSSCTTGAYINWDSISWSPVVQNMNEYKTRCELHFTATYTEGILNGTDPILEEPLIPVTIESDGTVKRADLESEWYSYANKEWANAVILFDESANANYQPGDTILESAIESYFVWIPKYRYQLWDLGQYDSLTSIDTSKVHEIPIIFGDYNTSDDVDGECATPMTSGATGNCAVGDYMTHPAFISIPSTGFWVGKFETGYRGATSTIEASQNINDSSKIIIKPKVYNWRGIQVANAFYTSYDYQRDLDSHMMKNTEWGAVAYLQHCAYGSSTSVRINNNSDYITGYAANNEPTCVWHGTSANDPCNQHCNDGSCNTAYPNSILASTTENISGIFDMSGGGWELTMAVMLDEESNPMSGYSSASNSGFNGINYDGSVTVGYEWPDKKYYDTYTYATVDTQYQKRILGDATAEMGPFVTEGSRKISSWYSDQASFVHNVYPWLMRGGEKIDGLDAGIFSFQRETGSFRSFRLILTLTS